MIIDHVDNLELPDKDAERYGNELSALQCLSTGLSFLNAQVQRIEADISGGLDKNKEYVWYINVPGLDGITRDLVTCAFHWYSVKPATTLDWSAGLATEAMLAKRVNI